VRYACGEKTRRHAETLCYYEQLPLAVWESGQENLSHPAQFTQTSFLPLQLDFLVIRPCDPWAPDRTGEEKAKVLLGGGEEPLAVIERIRVRCCFSFLWPGVGK
jgi:hypothetical protein